MPQCHPQQWYTNELYKSWLHVLLQLPCLQGKHLRTSSEEEKMPFIIVSRCKHSLVTCAFVKCLSHRHYAFKQHWNGLRCSNHATKWNSLWKCSSLPISKCYTLLKFSITSDSNFLFTVSFYVYQLTVSVVHCKILLQSSGYETVRSLGKMGACCVEHQVGWCLLSRISSHEVPSPDSLWYSPLSVKPALLGKNIIVLELNEPWIKSLCMEERDV